VSGTKGGDIDTEPQGDASSSVGETHRASSSGTKGSSSCQVTYDIVNEWPDGFQAAVTVTSAKALDDWRIAWTFADGQQITQMWDGGFTQTGSRVTATANDYNKKVPAKGDFGVGFLASWDDDNSAPADFTLNGTSCSTSE
jgi:cellulase/cellobiase CelA1